MINNDFEILEDIAGDEVANNRYQRALRGKKCLKPKTAWKDSFKSYIVENNVKSLYFNYTFGWDGVDFSFLSTLDMIEQLSIVNVPSYGLEAIEEMKALVDLSLSTYSKSKVDFTRLPKLKYCALDWHTGLESILEAKELVYLFIDEFKTKDFSKLANLTNLEVLTIRNSNIEDISCLSGSVNLKKLELVNCKKLTDFTPLTQLKNLEWLSIDGTKEVSNIEFVRNMTSLKILDVSDTNNIASIEPLKDLTGLKAVAFCGNKTTIVDGDLSYLTKLPNLALLWLAPRKHYSHKLIKQAHWDNFDKPDMLLAPK
jgi:Leucine-rich repeat (LRR) protein